jgi:hypothetical protein
MYGVIVDSIEIVLLGGTIQILNSYLGVERFILSVISPHPKSRIVAQGAPRNLYLSGFTLHSFGYQTFEQNISNLSALLSRSIEWCLNPTSDLRSRVC